ncbi:hypothetical protein [Streptomyces sp. CdTB01]|uniref:hypothetical protein n=1 Tax=Streptomyces sp. CdTB01 TaxID=1725411 RepID=UPI00073A61BE|nr:hypothetical protein [Streptomyces sp. CdTB01]ALV39111.1 enterobactin synthetase [Streptomyces sp. CdTB01]
MSGSGEEKLDGAAAVAGLTRLRPLLGAAGLGLGLAHVDEPRLGPAGPAEASAAATMTAGRRREFLAGREAARRALRAVGTACGEIPREGRLPVFAPGRAASISHSAGIAAAVAPAPGADLPVGCDLELRPLPCGAARLVLDPDEERLLGTASGTRGRPWSLTDLFSAKETAWKALCLTSDERVTPPMGTLRDLRIEACGDALRVAPRASASYAVRVGVLAVGAGVFSYALGWADAEGRATALPTARRS